MAIIELRTAELGIRVGWLRPAAALVRVRGDVDLATAPELESALRGVLAEGALHLVVDVSGVGFMDSSGLDVLARVREELVAREGAVALIGASPGMRRLLWLHGVDVRLQRVA